MQTAEVWSTSSAADVCRCGPQTVDVLPLKKQTAPKIVTKLFNFKCQQNPTCTDQNMVL
ncbi:hypothetical protein HanXRQr2_Chr10g0436111 [Helianthus annuus]|uniref:Uncharacterized protein n=1 Tax=Helianthus annuus TaxID=4232 RepID=A0A9K3HWX7_HELAN|nr:hypothetical protein HanXRQr2_Chr10g0436111 [Helianthus annuus]KAJ0883409.1 hypothetical protein HanPSC8_Chr10g0421171 [Helianthus annuus]